MDYSTEQQYNTTPIMRVGGGIKLPLPRKINDFTFQMWEEWSATSAAAGIAQSALASAGLTGVSGLGGSFLAAARGTRNFIEQEYGVTVNPAMFMLYRRPAYKEYELSWLLSASNKKDSDNLKKIIDTMKYNSLPSHSGRAPGLDQGATISALWDYPSLCLVSLTPDQYTFKFRPAVIVSVSADYHASGGPSYFNSGAPTVVSLSLRLKEISFWTKDNFRSESSLGV